MARKAARKTRRKPMVFGRRQTLKKDTISRQFLGRQLQKQINHFGMTRAQAGLIVQDAASQMSRLMTNHFEEFSADRLATMLVRLGSDITITIKHPKRWTGRKGKVRLQAS